MKSSALLCVVLTIAFIMATTHGLVGNVCTRKNVCIRYKRVCRSRWWGVCSSYKTIREGYVCNQQYCCPGSTDMGSGNCTMRTRTCCNNIRQCLPSVPGVLNFLQPPELADKIVAGKGSVDSEEYGRLLQEFLQEVNALLNKGFGCVLIHLNNPYILNQFYEKVNALLDQMIADNSYFHDNFRSKYYDRNHVVFWVRQRDRENISTLHLHTKVSWNGSLRPAKQGQVKQHIERASAQPQADTAEDMENDHKEQIIFIEGKVVETEDGVFQESIGIEAKSLSTEEQKHHLKWLFKMEKGGKLPGYITAFAKLDGGGSYYIGLEEEKQEITKTTGKGQVKIPQQTGKFICKGVPLSDTEKEALHTGIQNKTRDEMMWLSSEPLQNPVSVIFHPVQNPRGGAVRNLYVIEVKVEYLEGLAFWTKEGPQAFKVPESATSDPQPEPMAIDEWMHVNGGSLEMLKVQSPTFPLT